MTQRGLQGNHALPCSPLWVMLLYYNIVRLHTRVERTTSAREYPPKSGRECAVIARELPCYNRAVTPQTVHFRLDRKQRDHGVASVLCTFEPSALRLQCPGLRSAINLENCRNTIVFFLMLDHTRCHPPTRARLSGNCVLPPKLLNNSKYSHCLCGPFRLGMHSESVCAF
jgi:hypothetical protein